jgi:hypothetical protein
MTPNDVNDTVTSRRIVLRKLRYAIELAKSIKELGQDVPKVKSLLSVELPKSQIVSSGCGKHITL